MAFVRALYCSDRKGNKDSRQEEAQCGPVLRTFKEAFMEKQQQGSKATVSCEDESLGAEGSEGEFRRPICAGWGWGQLRGGCTTEKGSVSELESQRRAEGSPSCLPAVRFDGRKQRAALSMVGCSSHLRL